jgi:hypothetical protein
LLRDAFDRPDLPLVVVSAVAVVNGGPLEILRQAISEAREFREANFLFVVAGATRWEEGGNIRFLALPWASRSYLHRLFAEYVYFPQLSRSWKPGVWLSLLDTTPPVHASRQAVYCHNPLAYWHPSLRDFKLGPSEVLRSFAYGFVYRAFVGRNYRVIGQLPWYTAFIGSFMGVPRTRWLVVTPRPESPGEPSPTDGRSALAAPPHDQLECLYVSLPRVFKNFEEAVDLCNQPGVRLTVTLSGAENRYARHVRAYAGTRGQVRFAGRLSHPDALASIANADVVLYPSRLETFGLPIQEAMGLGRLLLLPVRPWTVAIAGGYERAYFYRSLDEGRAMLAAVARGEHQPTPWRPESPQTDLPRLSGFAELYGLLLT